MFGDNFRLIEVMILSIVKGFSDAGKDCYVSNATFADICKCKPRNIQYTLAKLKKDKLLNVRYKKIDGQGKAMRVLFV
jgi:hypothetical protein